MHKKDDIEKVKKHLEDALDNFGTDITLFSPSEVVETVLVDVPKKRVKNEQQNVKIQKKPAKEYLG